jgi:hypothetical protein
VKSNTRSWLFLTPKSATNESAGYCTLSTRQVMKVQTKNTCQLQNLNTLKNSYRTSTPNTCRSLVPFQFESPTSTSPNTHTPFKKTSFPIRSTLFPFIPSSSDTHSSSVKENPCTPTTSPLTSNITTKNITPIPFIPFHSFPHLSDTHYPQQQNRATLKHSHSPYIFRQLTIFDTYMQL